MPSPWEGGATWLSPPGEKPLWRSRWTLRPSPWPSWGVNTPSCCPGLFLLMTTTSHCSNLGESLGITGAWGPLRLRHSLKHSWVLCCFFWMTGKDYSPIKGKPSKHNKTSLRLSTSSLYPGLWAPSRSHWVLDTNPKEDEHQRNHHGKRVMG